jgi:hypothetical protein
MNIAARLLDRNILKVFVPLSAVGVCRYGYCYQGKDKIPANPTTRTFSLHEPSIISTVPKVKTATYKLHSIVIEKFITRSDGAQIGENKPTEAHPHEIDEDDEEDWEAKRESCGFCRMFLDSPCIDEFKAWHRCIHKAKKNGDDFVETCREVSGALFACTKDHEDHFKVLMSDQNQNNSSKEEGAEGNADKESS